MSSHNANQPEASIRLFDGDTGTLTAEQRRALAELIKGPYVSQLKTPDLFATISQSRGILASQLDNIFLSLIVDDTAGVAYTRVWTADVPEKRSLLRSMPLTFMDTVVLLHLRRELVTTNPNERTIVAKDDVFEATLPYQAAGGTDHAARRKKFEGAWNKMTKNSILISTPTEGRWEVSPVLRIIFSAEEIAQVTASYESLLEEEEAQ